MILAAFVGGLVIGGLAGAFVTYRHTRDDLDGMRVLLRWMLVAPEMQEPTATRLPDWYSLYVDETTSARWVN